MYQNLKKDILERIDKNQRFYSAKTRLESEHAAEEERLKKVEDEKTTVDREAMRIAKE
jgi:hypothetical protein